MNITAEHIRAASWHEAGHHLAANYFGIPSFPVVDAVDGINVPESEFPKLGVCEIEHPFTAYQDAVICWSGELAESLGGFFKLKSWKPQFVPDKRTLRDWWAMMTQRLHHFSDGDRRGILGCPARSWQACRSAFGILTKDKSRLRRMARIVARPAIENFTNQQPITSMQITPTTTNGQSSIAFRAAMLKRHLDNLSATDPDRPRFSQILGYLQNGMEPPNELFANDTTLNPASTALTKGEIESTTN